MKTYTVFKSKLFLEMKPLPVEGVALDNSEAVVNFAENVLNINSYPEEVAFVLCVNHSKQCINSFELSRGLVDEVPVGIKELLKRVLLANASGFLLIHNHPTTSAMPSQADFDITERLRQASQTLGIEFIDHIIIGTQSYLSLRELAKKEKTEW